MTFIRTKQLALLFQLVAEFPLKFLYHIQTKTYVKTIALIIDRTGENSIHLIYNNE